MKNSKKSKRRGRNAPGPYSTQGKAPFEYSTDYRNWFKAKTGHAKRYNVSSFA